LFHLIQFYSISSLFTARCFPKNTEREREREREKEQKV
jgi:hypothetical protein